MGNKEEKVNFQETGTDIIFCRMFSDQRDIFGYPSIYYSLYESLNVDNQWNLINSKRLTNYFGYICNGKYFY